MESNNTIAYDINNSTARMDDILNAGNDNYSDATSIPLRSSLTYTNGYYVYVTALFVDIVGSSDMTDEHKRPTLAKMYRSFISEGVAILNSIDASREINIHGDCVWAIFETPLKSDIDKVLNLAAKIGSMVDILNYKLAKKSYSTIEVGIGIEYGRALMVKAGYSGSGINDVIWMGDVVNSASNLCNTAGRNSRKETVISGVVYNNLNKDNQALFTSFTDDNYKTCYESFIVDKSMDEWYKENCK